MKRCLGLIAALGLATVASATSITWNGTNVTGSRTIFGTDATKTDFALAVKITTDFASNAAWTFNEAATYDGTLTADEITKLVDAGSAIMPTNIPEPTALALLALGVAGVALRRRVV